MKKESPRTSKNYILSRKSSCGRNRIVSKIKFRESWSQQWFINLRSQFAYLLINLFSFTSKVSEEFNANINEVFTTSDGIWTTVLLQIFISVELHKQEN